MRVAITGGRAFNVVEAMLEILDAAMKAAVRKGEVLVVIHGACGPDRAATWTHDDVTGADGLAHRWALWRIAQGHAIEVVAVPAEWRRFGRPAGMRRNLELVTEHRPDVLVVFPGGVGTTNAKDQAIRNGVRVGFAEVYDLGGFDGVGRWRVRWPVVRVPDP